MAAAYASLPSTLPRGIIDRDVAHVARHRDVPELLHQRRTASVAALLGCSQDVAQDAAHDIEPISA